MNFFIEFWKFILSSNNISIINCLAKIQTLKDKYVPIEPRYIHNSAVLFSVEILHCIVLGCKCKALASKL